MSPIQVGPINMLSGGSDSLGSQVVPMCGVSRLGSKEAVLSLERAITGQKEKTVPT